MIQNEKEARRRKKNLCKKSKLLSNGEKKRVQMNRGKKGKRIRKGKDEKL